jgi:hypothetical protein
LSTRRETFLEMYNSLLHNDEFVAVITSGTAQMTSVKKRHEMFQATIDEVISR